MANKSSVSEVPKNLTVHPFVSNRTTTELNLADFFSSNNMSYEAVTIETNDEADKTTSRTMTFIRLMLLD